MDLLSGSDRFRQKNEKRSCANLKLKSGCVYLPTSTHYGIQKQTDKKWPLKYQPTSSDYQPPFPPSSLLYSGLAVTSTSLSTQSWITPIKVRFISLSSSFSPPLHSFSCPVHIMNEQNMWRCVSAFVCLCDGTQFQRRRLTLNETDGKTGRRRQMSVSEEDGGVKGGMNGCNCWASERRPSSQTG